MKAISRAAQAMGRKGGAVAQSRRTPEQRSAIGRKGGLVGGVERARQYPKEWQVKNAKRAAKARWERVRVLGVTFRPRNVGKIAQ